MKKIYYIFSQHKCLRFDLGGLESRPSTIFTEALMNKRLSFVCLSYTCMAMINTGRCSSATSFPRNSQINRQKRTFRLLFDFPSVSEDS